ncbi:MAG TPA: rhodanese-like domain-containing protein [Chloroflexota bacterium]|nr:rhodanese-like domain-containing protein [Chloroflexota bacterium]
MATTDGGYAHPELLVETEWLAEHLDDPSIRIVDCDVPDAYGRSHIPNAVAIPGHHYLKEVEGSPHLMGPEKFARTMATMGIGDDTTVISYCNRGGVYSSRFWWALNYYGHTNAKVLNGGWKKWFLEQRPLSNKTPKVDQRTFTPRVSRELIATADDVCQVIGDSSSVILDVRADDEYAGTNARGTKRGGRIPGAVHLEWVHYLTTDDYQTWLPANTLRERFEALGITRDKRVYTY